MEDVLDRFRAGEPLASVATDFDLDHQDMEDVIRAALRPPRDPPEFFVDRSLGYHMLPDTLRALGLVVDTMRSVYGPDAEQTVPDVVWLEQAGRAGWVGRTKDDAIRRRPVELQALAAHGVRAFCLTNANLTGEQQRDRFLASSAPTGPAAPDGTATLAGR